MGKKSTEASTRTPKHEKNKQHIHNLIKILRPKVYITDSSNFKNLVQQLTGNGNSLISSPPPSFSPVPFIDQENSLEMSFDSSCFSTPLEGSPDLTSVPDSDFNYLMEGSQKIDFSSHYNMDLESLLMGIDSVSYNHDSCYGIIQQEACVYDYDISSFI